jgi:hypothetical protein
VAALLYISDDDDKAVGINPTAFFICMAKPSAAPPSVPKAHHTALISRQGYQSS